MLRVIDYIFDIAGTIRFDWMGRKGMYEVWESGLDSAMIKIIFTDLVPLECYETIANYNKLAILLVDEFSSSACSLNRHYRILRDLRFESLVFFELILKVCCWRV